MPNYIFDGYETGHSLAVGKTNYGKTTTMSNQLAIWMKSHTRELQIKDINKLAPVSDQTPKIIGCSDD